MTVTFAVKFDPKRCCIYRYVGRDALGFGYIPSVEYKFNLAELHSDIRFARIRLSQEAIYYLPLIELLGKTFDDPSVQDYMKHCPFPIISENNQPRFVAKEADKTWTFSIEEVLAITMKKAVITMICTTDWEELDGKRGTWMEEISRIKATKLKNSMTELAVVVVVPNSFGEAQRRAMMVAAGLARMNVTHIVSQATSVGYFFNTAFSTAPDIDEESRLSQSGNFLFFHFGLSSLDISIIKHDEEEKLTEIKLATGDSAPRGKDFIHRLMEGVPKEFIDGESRRFQQACMLLNHDEFAFVPPPRKSFYWLERGTLKNEEFKEYSDMFPAQHPDSCKLTPEQRKEAYKAEKAELEKVSYRLTRQMYEQKCADLLERVKQLLSEAISEAGIAPSDYKAVLMYGEYCRLPRIVDMIREQLPDTLISFGDTLPYYVIENNVEYLGKSRERSDLQPWLDGWSHLYKYDYDLIGAACMSFVLNRGRPLYRDGTFKQAIRHKNLRLINKSQVEHLVPNL